MFCHFTVPSKKGGMAPAVPSMSRLPVLHLEPHLEREGGARVEGHVVRLQAQRQMQGPLADQQTEGGALDVEVVDAKGPSRRFSRCLGLGALRTGGLFGGCRRVPAGRVEGELCASPGSQAG